MRSPPKPKATILRAGLRCFRRTSSMPRATAARCVRWPRAKAGRFRFYDERALRRLGAGAFLAVSRANDHRASGIVRLRYRPRGRTARRFALVGKGICFDTGRHQSQDPPQHVPDARRHAGQRGRRRHPARADAAPHAGRSRLLARNHGERDRPERLPAAGCGPRAERRHHPGGAQRRRGPHGARRHARARRARTPRPAARLRNADGRLRQRAHRALQRRVHEPPGAAR